MKPPTAMSWRNPGVISAVLISYNSIKNIPIRQLFLLVGIHNVPDKGQGFLARKQNRRKLTQEGLPASLVTTEGHRTSRLRSSEGIVARHA